MAINMPNNNIQLAMPVKIVSYESQIILGAMEARRVYVTTLAWTVVCIHVFNASDKSLCYVTLFLNQLSFLIYESLLLKYSITARKIFRNSYYS